MFTQILTVLDPLAGVLSAGAAIAAAIAAWRSSGAATRSAEAAGESVTAANKSACAATEAVTAARRSADAAENAIKLAERHEADRIRMVKGKHELEHMTNLIVTFAELRATTLADPGNERDLKLTEAIGSIEFQVSVLESLDAGRGPQIRSWLDEPRRRKRLVPVARSVWGTNRRLGRANRAFLAEKMEALRDLQERLFESMTGSPAPQPAASEATRLAE